MFGSILREDFNNDSDIDLLVEFELTDFFKYADIYFDFKYSLQDILKRKVDLFQLIVSISKKLIS